MSVSRERHQALLLRIARQAMIERGFEPDFSPAAIAEASGLPDAPPLDGPSLRDLRELLWCSIDNDDSRDLDQLTVALPIEDGAHRVLVAVADVSSLVERGSALDDHASVNTTSVYTPPKNFPMLPDRLSADLTSLVPERDRAAVVVDMVIEDGRTRESSVYPARVRNHAKLAYSGVGPWLEGNAAPPSAIGKVDGLAENLRLQDRLAQKLKVRRHEQGALELESTELLATFVDGEVTALSRDRRNRAKELIEDFMIAANGAVARFLEGRGFPVVHRVVRRPERWPRIVELAAALGEKLPAEPDVRALHLFLLSRRAADPVGFPDLSLSVVKLLGSGEYEVAEAGRAAPGHFGLAVREYTHSTAPNRRFPDLITQRLLKAALARLSIPYDHDQLTALAMNCTTKEDAAQKVERLVRKATAACWLSSRIGQEFDGIVTGATAKGTWARIFDPPVEGRIERGEEGLDVGDRVRLKLVHTDPERGFIDFHRVGHRAVGRR